MELTKEEQLQGLEYALEELEIEKFTRSNYPAYICLRLDRFLRINKIHSFYKGKEIWTCFGLKEKHYTKFQGDFDNYDSRIKYLNKQISKRKKQLTK